MKHLFVIFGNPKVSEKNPPLSDKNILVLLFATDIFLFIHAFIKYAAYIQHIKEFRQIWQYGRYVQNVNKVLLLSHKLESGLSIFHNTSI